MNIKTINEIINKNYDKLKNRVYIFSPFSGSSNLIPSFTFIIFIIIILIILLIVMLIRVMNINIRSYFDNKKEIPTKTKYADLYNENMTYYVCSYGGCGSYMLCDYLRNFGKVEHIHSRKPPKKLTYVGEKNTQNKVYGEWFNDSIIPKKELKNHKVIYLYKDPVKAILSRFDNPEHLNHIQCNESIKFKHILDTRKDLYKLEEFFNNYTGKGKNKEKNYPIYCVKYEEFWNNISLFNEIIGLPDIKELYPIRKETHRNYGKIDELYKIYRPLQKKMDKMPFIKKC